MEPINYKLAKRVIRQCRNSYPQGRSLREMYLYIHDKSLDEIRVVVEQLVKAHLLEAIHITGKVGRPTTRYHLSTTKKFFIWHCSIIAETQTEAKSVFERWCSEKGYSMISGDITEFECGDVVYEPFTLIV